MRAKVLASRTESGVKPKKIVLAGNPNAGKTTLFNALTRSSLRTGNFHGVTTSPASKTVGGVEFTDVPGAYAFHTFSMEEASAVKEIKSADLVVNVVDALTLENSLNFTRGIIAEGCATVVYITKYQSLLRRGGKIDFEKLSAILGVPVLNCPPKKLKEYIKSGFPAPSSGKYALNEAYSRGNAKASKLDRLFYSGFFALPFFIISVVVMFALAFHPAMPGAYLKGLLERLLESIDASVAGNMQSEVAASLFSEAVISGAGSVMCFIPQLAVLYLFLILLDESGITSALAFATDGVFEKVRLSGRAAFSLVTGFGCTAAAILTTRGYTSPSAQKRTVAVLPFVPCGAKLPVFLTLLSPLFKNPFPVITCFYFAGLAAAVAASYVLKGGAEGMLSEVTPIVVPRLKAVAYKLCFQLKGFIIKAAGIVTLFCLLNWALSHYSFSFGFVSLEESMLAHISRALLPMFVPMGICDWRVAYAALCGFVAKENVAATLSQLMPEGTGLTLSPALALCAFILLCPACISAFSASCKEVGVKFSLKCLAVQLALALAGGYIVRLLTIWL